MSIAVIGVLREVLEGNDPELPQLCDRSNFRFAQSIAAIAIIEGGTTTCDVNLTCLLQGPFCLAFSLRRSERVSTHLKLNKFAFERAVLADRGFAANLFRVPRCEV